MSKLRKGVNRLTGWARVFVITALLLTVIVSVTSMASAVAITTNQVRAYEDNNALMVLWSNDANNYLAVPRGDPTSGGLVVHLDDSSLTSVTISGAIFSGTDGTTGPAQAISVGGTDSGGLIQEILVLSTGEVMVQADATTLAALESITIAGAIFSGTDNATGPDQAVSIGGTDENGKLQEIAVSEDGDVYATLTFGDSSGATSKVATGSVAEVIVSAGPNKTRIWGVFSGTSATAVTIYDGTASAAYVIAEFALPAGGSIVVPKESAIIGSSATQMLIETSATDLYYFIRYDEMM